MKPDQCPATTVDRATDEETRCILPAGHDGRHDDGCLTWTWGDVRPIFGTVTAEGPIRLTLGTGASTPEPPPTPGTGDVWQSVIERLPPGKLRDACVERRAFGLRKYGTVLQANNGRDCWADAWQEVLDLIAYTAQGVMEGDPRAMSLHVAALELAELLLEGDK